MANEARVNFGMTIVKDNLNYRPATVSFQADVFGTKGPSPGAFLVGLGGTDCDFSQLDSPSLAIFRNLSADYYVSYGIYDPENNKYFPLGELLPGESWPIRLARDLASEYGTAAGTAPTGSAVNRLRFKAVGGTAVVVVEAFEF